LVSETCLTEEERLKTIKRIEEKLYKLSNSKLTHLEKVLEREEIRIPYIQYIGDLLGIHKVNDQLVMELGPQNYNTANVAHGGALYTFADIALGSYIGNQLPPNKRVFTLEMKMNFIKKGVGEKLIAKPRIVQFGSRIVFGECTIFDEEGDIVANSNGSFYITTIK